MKTINNLFFQTSMHKRITHNFLFGLITATTLVLSTLSLKANAQNLSVNKNEITSYAQALLAIEPARQQAFGAIKKIVGNENVPKIVCNQPNSMNDLPNRAREIAVNYCKQSQEIVENHGLTIDKFNRITMEIPKNNNLKQEIYETLVRLQNK
ncbi:DUF4168 domain-containing protein [Anabaena sp. UHCC 0399]|uniref:DUF4168 domain-containing protein n=1 Tax=Anabaena sp. UHCC 0399 TaxID=3110238 RepID=UPI002B2178B9|nr:DUF4168 domain-containing protein [Anabaena sp. UHCC 0399]MEA5565203.1 DUF4168 domain-containing protein [Anabaena sp. UHCC 0399]